VEALADPLRAQIIALLADGPACNCHSGRRQPP
jgi:DNA-binding transcriptional ArsR family regulator